MEARRTGSLRGFTLVELLLVILIIAVLSALLFPVLSSARRSSRLARCSENLRQIGAAARMYADDYSAFPLMGRVFRSRYVPDRRVLVCPEDRTFVPEGAMSSYVYRPFLPPDFRSMEGNADIDPTVVLLSCENHLARKTIVEGDAFRPGPPAYPYYLVLRAGGAVHRVHASQVREAPVPAERPTFTRSYPGEPAFVSRGRIADAH